ncbi:MAG TPA: cytochrome c biogenesis protein CcdA [Gaiellales bacterium]|nr:cytochrome c biogenesis protein CcdA [Gaiellales bacterium]
MTAVAAAFAAGLVSFATPCVLPLVPAYLSAIGVRSGDARGSLRAAVPFVAGFTVVFVALGAAASVAGAQLSDHRLDLIRASGIVIVAMGLMMAGVLRVPLFERSVAPAVGLARASGSSLALGGAFGLCWTPCVGPLLASLLALASSTQTVARGAGLLFAYSAGLAVPLLLASLALGRVMGAARLLRDRYDLVRVVSGTVLVAAGLLVFFDRVWMVNAFVGGI